MEKFIPYRPEVTQNATIISTQEILNLATADFGKQMFSGALSKGQVEQFVNQRVIGAKLNGFNILSIDFEHDEGSVNPVLQAYIKSPNTKMVVPEYFYPEMTEWLDSDLIKFYRKTNDWQQGHQDRVDFAERLAETFKEANKLVAVTDIANKPLYPFIRGSFRAFPGFLSIAAGINESLKGGNDGILSSFLYYLFIAVPDIIYLKYLDDSFDEGKFIFDKEIISRVENLIPDFEQARRLYKAKGLRQLTEEYAPVSNQEEEEPQLIVLDPRAHGIRVLGNLVNPSKADTARDRFYKFFGPGLDFSVRQWVYKDSLQKLAESGYRWKENDSIQEEISSKTKMKPSLANWMLVSERKIGI